MSSVVLGAVAGLVVGIAYLIPQWIGTLGAPGGPEPSGVLEPSGTAVTANDKIQFVSAALVALSAGIGFDTVFSRLQERARDVPVVPP